jgi:hypothetical protein
MKLHEAIMTLQDLERKHGSDLELAAYNPRFGEYVEAYDFTVSMPSEMIPLATRDMEKLIDEEHKFVQVIL